MDQAELRKKLETRLNQLAVKVDDIDHTLMEASPADFEEQATEAEGDEVLEGLSQAGHDEIDAIRAALKRMNEGTYGVCVSCGEDIAPKRLEALPHAALCISCA
ncbi:MAG: TraR/DksA family transcriptional regulator [Minwuiales bacterium]|nr:TraR/DksA family transcriptional regulator [Minwuiales bacterium]